MIAVTSALFGAVMPHPPIMVAGVGGARAEVTRASIDAAETVREALANFDPDVVVVMSPHAPSLMDGFAVDDSEVLEGSFAQFGDSHTYTWRGDHGFASAIVEELEHAGVPVARRTAEPRLKPGVLDHAVLVPMSFLDPNRHWPLVILSLSYLDYAKHRQLGEAVARAAARWDRRVAFIASGDLSHRLTPDAPAGYSPRASELDDAIVGLVEKGRLGELMRIDPSIVEAGGECGLRSFIALGGLLGDDPVPTRVLAYEGPWGVGYLTALAGQDALTACDGRSLSRATSERGHKGGTAGGTTPARGRKGGTPGADDSEIVRLARSAIERWVADGATLGTAELGDEYPAQAGAFVSLHAGGQLRGCIGTISPTQSTLAEEVVHNAIEAATHDPRFQPVSPSELDLLDITVDVLRAPESCDLSDLDPSIYGVIVSSGRRRGLLLPDLEGIDEIRDQVSIAMQKAGIAPGESCSYERFRVDRYT